MKFTDPHRQTLIDYLASHDLPKGLGDKESACSIAAINLAISGELKDEVPECMSLVLGRAVITLQDSIPHEMRNSDRYKSLLPQMAGTGRDFEEERSKVLLDWIWDTVLPQIQPIADRHGFGDEWAEMCTKKDKDAARAAARAAGAAALDAEDDSRADARAVACAARYAAVAVAARDAAGAAAAASRAADGKSFWEAVDPIGALERATELK